MCDAVGLGLLSSRAIELDGSVASLWLRILWASGGSLIFFQMLRIIDTDGDCGHLGAICNIQSLENLFIELRLSHFFFHQNFCITQEAGEESLPAAS